MKVVLSTIGKFHTFDLARELHARRVLCHLFTGYPRFKIKSEGIPAHLISTFPWIHAPYMMYRRRSSVNDSLVRQWEYIDRVSFDWSVRERIALCDIFVGLSGSSLRSGLHVQRQGAKYVCDRGSSHIRCQDALLKQEYERWGLHYTGIDGRIIDGEETEYACADMISVPSTFSRQSFVTQGIPENKVVRLPYGVDLGRFARIRLPKRNSFNVLFVGAVSLRKGVPDLLRAFSYVRHPQKLLTLAGGIDPAFVALMKRHALWPASVKILGHVPQSDLSAIMSASDVLVLPSIEEGFGMVMAQAMACGCPVIASRNTGAPDLFQDGKEGFIVPIRDPLALGNRLQQLADDEAYRDAMSDAALARVATIGGWDNYGEAAIQAYRRLLSVGLSNVD